MKKLTLFNVNNATGLGWNSVYGPLYTVEFKGQLSLKDKFGALSCISIFTSDGKIGTLTHLSTVDIDSIDRYILCLNKVLANSKDSSVILIGGSKIKESKRLHSLIKSKLEQNNYKIVAQYLSQEKTIPVAKQGVLFADKVVVEENIKDRVQETTIDFKTGFVSTVQSKREFPIYIDGISKKN